MVDHILLNLSAIKRGEGARQIGCRSTAASTNIYADTAPHVPTADRYARAHRCHHRCRCWLMLFFGASKPLFARSVFETFCAHLWLFSIVYHCTFRSFRKIWTRWNAHKPIWNEAVPVALICAAQIALMPSHPLSSRRSYSFFAVPLALPPGFIIRLQYVLFYAPRSPVDALHKIAQK